MKDYLHAKAAKLLEELEKVPLTDTCDEDKFKLLMIAMRETSVEMFQRAAANARRDIAAIQAEALAEDIREVEESTPPPKEHKIQLKSSILRRVDNH